MSNVDLRGKRILVVADSPSSAQKLEALFSLLHWNEIRLAHTAPDATRTAATFLPQLVVINVTSHETGPELFAALRGRREKEEMKLAALIDPELPASEHQALKDAGCDVTVLRPADPNSLLRALDLPLTSGARLTPPTTPSKTSTQEVLAPAWINERSPIWVVDYDGDSVLYCVSLEREGYLIERHGFYEAKEKAHVAFPDVMILGERVRPGRDLSGADYSRDIRAIEGGNEVFVIGVGESEVPPTGAPFDAYFPKNADASVLLGHVEAGFRKARRKRLRVVRASSAPSGR